MDSPDSIKFYINTTWYPGTEENPSKEYVLFKNETSWTDGEIASFFDTKNSSSFGYALEW